MTVGDLAARLSKCNQDAPIYVMANGVRYQCMLVDTEHDCYLMPDRKKHVPPGLEIVRSPDKDPNFEPDVA